MKIGRAELGGDADDEVAGEVVGDVQPQVGSIGIEDSGEGRGGGDGEQLTEAASSGAGELGVSGEETKKIGGGVRAENGEPIEEAAVEVGPEAKARNEDPEDAGVDAPGVPAVKQGGD